jgi:hypothetical protein
MIPLMILQKMHEALTAGVDMAGVDEVLLDVRC